MVVLHDDIVVVVLAAELLDKLTHIKIALVFLFLHEQIMHVKVFVLGDLMCRIDVGCATNEHIRLAKNIRFLLTACARLYHV